jgi:hypothetical protein
MHNRALHDSLAAFVEEAAWQLAEEVAAGAEVPFELIEQGRASAPLYCYRPLTDRFIAEHLGMLERLPSYPAARQGLAALPNLGAYLISRGRRAPAGDRRAQGDAALEAFITALWGDATDFVYEGERFTQIYLELEEAVYDGCSLSVVLAPVEGLVIDGDEVALGDGLALVRGSTLLNTPTDLRGDDYATIAVLHLESAPGESPSLEQAGRRLRRLQTALRLWDDAEPSLAPVAWARTDGGPWMSVPLATGLRRMDGDCLLAPEEEDPLRAFCALAEWLAADRNHLSHRLGSRGGETAADADPVTRHGFTQVPNFLLTNKDLSVGAKLTYAMLLKYAWADDAVFPGQKKLADDMGSGERSVRTEPTADGLLIVDFAADGRQTGVGIVAAQEQTVLGARSEHAIWLAADAARPVAVFTFSSGSICDHPLREGRAAGATYRGSLDAAVTRATLEYRL